MQFLKKSVAVAAVVGVLAVAPKATAGFTPPTSLAPYLPAANVVTVTKVGTVGSYTIWACSMGSGIVLPSSTPQATVQIMASANCSWQAFRLNTVSADSLSNGTVVNQASLWWTANVKNPYYVPLLNAVTSATARAAAVQSIQSGAAGRVAPAAARGVMPLRR